MTLSARGATHRGKTAAVPQQRYEPTVDIVATSSAIVIEFVGEDGRTKTFDVGRLPLPLWHPPLATAFAEWVGPAGTRRTQASAVSAWIAVGRFVRFLADLPDPPARPEQLTTVHVDTYLHHRVQTVGPKGWREIDSLRALFRSKPLCELASPAVLDCLQRRMTNTNKPSRPGYSDGEFTRIVAAARTEIAAMRDRIDAGDRLLTMLATDPTTIPAEDVDIATQLAHVANTGTVPLFPGMNGATLRTVRLGLARRLFVTRADREAMLILLVAVSGRNSETIKELPAEHRVLDGRAVEIRAVKRRRGPQRWSETVTWEIGPPHRELHTPGGLYLLLHRLMARSRRFSESSTMWSTWTMSYGDIWGTPGEHRDTFAQTLSPDMQFGQWSTRHGLRSDPTSTGDDGEPLPVDLGRLRTTVEVRRTRALGGHLPSAARSNSVAVLFANYLRGDPHAREWAEEVLGEAVADAEGAALAVHRDTLQEVDKVSLDVRDRDVGLEPVHEGAWTACADPDSHPVTEKPCRRVSFLDCFHCGNCLITPAHLPAILALLDTITERRVQLGDTDWWIRYGPVWAAIRRDVLPRFTPAELRAAERSKPVTPLLELAEDPWERP